MDFGTIVAVLHGWFFLLIAFFLSLALAMVKGRQNLINLIMGLYVGLLLYTLFPYKELFLNQVDGDKSKALISIGIFTVLSIFGTWLFGRLMPREYLEGTFETFGKKLILAFVAMVLVMTLSHHYLPVDVILNTGTPLPEYLQSENFSFWWLTLPLVALILI